MPQPKDDYYLHLVSAFLGFFFFFLFWLINLETFSFSPLLEYTSFLDIIQISPFWGANILGCLFDTGKKEGREWGRKYSLSIRYVAVTFTSFFKINLQNDLGQGGIIFPFYKRGNSNLDLLVFLSLNSKSLEVFWFQIQNPNFHFFPEFCGIDIKHDHSI